MFYFVAPYAPPSEITGVERAEYSRYHVFRDNGVMARLISLQFNQFIIENSHKYRLDLHDVINMFDYFCHIDYFRPAKKQQVTPSEYDSVQEGGLLTRYFLLGHLIRKVRRDSNQNLISVYDYNPVRRSRSVTFYRPNGDIAVRHWFNENGKNFTEYLDQQGRPCITLYFDDEEKLRGILLRDWQNGEVRRFSSIDQLAGYFLDLIVSLSPSPIFITDHTSDLIPSLNSMSQRVSLYAFIHSAVSVTEGQVEGYYRPLAAQISKWQGVITSTARQAQDLQKIWPEIPVLHANVSVATQADLKTSVPDFADRDPHKLVMLARVDPAKNIEAAIEILKFVRTNLPATILEIWGDAEIPAFVKYRNKLDKIIKDNHLDDAIHFCGYTAHPEQVLDSARVVLVTSHTEGTALVINEALSRAVPVVSLDFDYGPREFLRDGVNGYLVEQHDYARAARCCIELLTNEQLWRKRATAARQRAQRFDAAHNWHQWQKVIQAMQEVNR